MGSGWIPGGGGTMPVASKGTVMPERMNGIRSEVDLVRPSHNKCVSDIRKIKQKRMFLSKTRYPVGADPNMLPLNLWTVHARTRVQTRWEVA